LLRRDGAQQGTADGGRGGAAGALARAARSPGNSTVTDGGLLASLPARHRDLQTRRAAAESFGPDRVPAADQSSARDTSSGGGRTH